MSFEGKHFQPVQPVGNVSGLPLVVTTVCYNQAACFLCNIIYAGNITTNDPKAVRPRFKLPKSLHTLQKVVEAQSLLSGVGKAKESEGAKCKLPGQGELGYLERGESEAAVLMDNVWSLLFRRSGVKIAKYTTLNQQVF